MMFKNHADDDGAESENGADGEVDVTRDDDHHLGHCDYEDEGRVKEDRAEVVRGKEAMFFECGGGEHR